jgi:hypothetical protein
VALALDGPTTPPEAESPFCALYRFRACPLNAADQCILFSPAPDATEAASLDGVVVTAQRGLDAVDIENATFVGNTATGPAGWSLTYTPGANPNFQLNTAIVPLGKLSFSISGAGASFDIGSFAPANSGTSSEVPTSFDLSNGSTPFDGINSFDGRQVGTFALEVGVNGKVAAGDLFDSLTLTPSAGEELIISAFQSVSFFVHLTDLGTTPTPPLSERPCAGRDEVRFGGSAIVTHAFKTPDVVSVLDHPLLFDAVSDTTSQSGQVSWAEFAREARLVGGRLQVLLRDVVEDRNTFSRYSAFTHFTPCFRVDSSPDFQLELFTSLQSHASLLRLYIPDNIFADELGCLPLPAVSTFNGDSSTLYPVQELVLSGDSGSGDQTFVSFDSDMEWVLEPCPEFSYFA